MSGIPGNVANSREGKNLRKPGNFPIPGIPVLNPTVYGLFNFDWMETKWTLYRDWMETI